MRKRRILAAVIGIVCLFSGCSSFTTPDESAITIGKDGDVTGVAVENLDKDYYNETELKSMIENEISEYQAGTGEDSVKMDKFSVKDKKAKLVIDYASWKDYADFNKVVFFVGKISKAQEAGITFSGTFKAVEDGEAEKSGLDAGQVTAKDYNVAVLEEPVLVEVPGTIVYVSENVQVSKKSQAKVLGDEAEGQESQEKSEQDGAENSTEDGEAANTQTEQVMLEPENVGTDALENEIQAGKKLAYIIYE